MAERPILFWRCFASRNFRIKCDGSAIFAERRLDGGGGASVSTCVILVVLPPCLPAGPAVRRATGPALRWDRIYMQHEEGPCR
jgi:hypothetical protein